MGKPCGLIPRRHLIIDDRRFRLGQRSACLFYFGRAVSVVAGLRLADFVDVGEPRAGGGPLARCDVEEGLLDALCDFAALAVPDFDAVNRADGCDLGSRAGEEQLVGDVERGTLDIAFDDWDFQLATNLYDAVARDAGQNRA